jgi:preprotein translocase subunit SecA
LQLAERARRIAPLYREQTDQGAGLQTLEHFPEIRQKMPAPELEIEAYAPVRKATRRALSLDPFDVQMIAAVAMSGLYVIGTSRHESLRIDRQLMGRAGRRR